MTEQNPKMDGQTKRALDLAIARRQVSQDSYRAVLDGRISLQEAKTIGRAGTPATDAAQGHSGPGTTTEIQDEPARRTAGIVPTPSRTLLPARASRRASPRTDHTPTKTPCLCGCGRLVGSRFATGHDMRMFRVAREHLEQGRELTDEQREYLESSDKMRRVRDRIAEEERKRQESIARKTERQHKKEGEAETKRRNEELRRGQGDRR